MMMFQEATASVIAGCLSGTITSTMTHPLDVLKTAYQTVGVCSVSLDEASLSLATGMEWTVGSAVTGFLCFFSTLEMVSVPGLVGNTFSAVLMRTTVASTLATLVNTPFQLMKTQSIVSACQGNGSSGSSFSAIGNEILATYGVTGLWRGLYGNMAGVIQGALQFSLYHFLMNSSVVVASGSAAASSTTNKQQQPRGLRYFLLSGAVGVVSSCLALLVVFPLDTVKATIMGGTSAELQLTLLEATQKVVSTRGVSGVYDGLGFALASQCLVSFLMFSMWPMFGELIRKQLMSRRHADKVTAVAPLKKKRK